MNGSLRSAHAPLLDCIQVNLAALADQCHGPGTCLRLGATLRFRCWPAAGRGLPTVEPPLDEQLAAAGPLLGLAVTERRDGVAAGELLAALGSGTCYVVADAWHLPWTPYHRRRRMRHSFLVSRPPGTQPRITDFYHNDTSWGRSRPGQWPLTDAELAAALPDGAVTAIWFTPVPLDPVRPVTDVTGIDGYLREYRQASGTLATLDQMCLETWLLDRSRRLHAAFLAERAAFPAECDAFPVERAAAADECAAPGEATAGARIEAHLAAWRQLTEQAYLMFRRAERGRPEPAGLIDRLADLLRADTAVFGAATARPATVPAAVPAARVTPARPAAGAARPPVLAAKPAAAAAAPPPDAGLPDPLWPLFAEAVGRILRVSPAAVAGAGSLADLPSWNSLRLVETIEKLESLFCFQFGPDDLVPERLSDPAYLFALVRTASRTASRTGHRTREDLR